MQTVPPKIEMQIVDSISYDDYWMSPHEIYPSSLYAIDINKVYVIFPPL